MSEQELFQEKPKDATACTLVKDSHDTKRVRNYMKSKVSKLLQLNPEDFDVEETEVSWTATQRYTNTPAIINLRLKSYKKGMTLVAYNSFEVYHGGCSVTSMRIKNDLTTEKMNEHVDNAIKTFKGQAKFNESEAKKYKTKNAAKLKREQEARVKLVSIFAKIGIKPDSDGMVGVLNYYWQRQNDEDKRLIQLDQLARCNAFIFANKKITPAKEWDERLSSKCGVYISGHYRMEHDYWFISINDLPVDKLMKIYQEHQKPVKITWMDDRRSTTKKRVDYYRPGIDIGNGASHNSEDKVQVKKTLSTKITLVINTNALSKMMKEFNLHSWKIKQD